MNGKLTKKYIYDADGDVIGYHLIDDEGYIHETHYYEDDA